MPKSSKTRYPAIRVSAAAKQYLHERSLATGSSMSEYVENLLNEDARRQWFQEAKDFYARDPEALAEQKAETSEIEKALFND